MENVRCSICGNHIDDELGYVETRSIRLGYVSYAHERCYQSKQPTGDVEIDLRDRLREDR
jgi:hypothetical protein